jgi:hypothetical protein
MATEDYYEWNNKVLLIEKIDELLVAKDSQGSPMSFDEGLALYLAQAYLQEQHTEELRYGYVTQKAA